MLGRSTGAVLAAISNMVAVAGFRDTRDVAPVPIVDLMGDGIFVKLPSAPSASDRKSKAVYTGAPRAPFAAYLTTIPRPARRELEWPRRREARDLAAAKLFLARKAAGLRYAR